MMSLLGFLDISGGDRIRSNTFRKVEKHVGIIEQQVTKEGIRESLIEEIKCTLRDSKIDFDIWKNDEGWQVRGSGGWQARGSGGKFSSVQLIIRACSIHREKDQPDYCHNSIGKEVCNM
jgi:hypothetical protein